MPWYQTHRYSLLKKEHEGSRDRPPSSSLYKLLLFFLICCLYLLVAVGAYLVGKSTQCSPHTSSPQSPHKFKVNQVAQTFRYNRSFSETPSLHTERSWRAIFPNEGGFFVHPTVAPTRSTFSVFHQLHCLDGLRQGYWANHNAAVQGHKLTDDDLPVDIQPSHMRHCIDLLRQSLMCHADTTIEVVDEKINGVHGFRTEHQCGDWQQLIDWTNKAQMRQHVEQIVKV